MSKPPSFSPDSITRGKRPFDKLREAGSFSILLLLLLPVALHAQQGPPPGVVQQPFGQKPPPPPPPPPPPTAQQQQQLDREHHRLPGWLYRGLVAGADRADEVREIDTPVTGYGNEALWDVPRLAPLAIAAAATPRPKVAAARRQR